MSKSYILEDVCCEKCARKIEKGTNLLEGVHKASLDENNILTVEFEAGIDASLMFEKLKEVVSTSDPDATIQQVIA